MLVKDMDKYVMEATSVSQRQSKRTTEMMNDREFNGEKEGIDDYGQIGEGKTFMTGHSFDLHLGT